uniref:Armadillo-like helical domain containing protein 1 n=2 Tax=Schistosoma mansoni TaxID=6183 RepID=A0A3Q0KMJ5_SCHMA
MASAKQDIATYNVTCLLRQWDCASEEKRRQLLDDFIKQYYNRTGPDLESEFAQMASLFLARICVWIKLTYMSGTCLTEQLQALHVFLSASNSYNYLLEFLEHGGVLCLQEVCISSSAKEVDKRWALKVLSCVANAGTHYKETICECYGIRAVAECMAKSKSEETQESARDLLEILAEGNPRFSDQVYKGLIGVLPCNSPKAQQLALQSIRILQAKRNTANRALIDRIVYLLESLHLEVQSAVIELVRVLMGFDIVDDILMALITLLKPQHEIQLGKLFTEVTSDDNDDEISSPHMDSNEERYPSHPAPLGSRNISGIPEMKPRSMSNTKSTKLNVKYPSTCANGNSDKTEKMVKKKHRHQSQGSDSEFDGNQPLSVFVQQAAAAKCLHILSQDSSTISRKIIKMGALSNLLYAMGNLEFSDSQRQASLALEYLCQTYPLVDEIVSEAMGPVLHEEFIKNPDSHYLQMTPLQADILVSNKVNYTGEGL